MSREQDGQAHSFRAMGVDVVVGGAGRIELRAISRVFDAWDRVFSRFRSDSELTRVNETPADTLVVSPVFARAVRTALGAAAATDGLVDPTLGTAIEAAGYDRDFAELGDDPRPLGPTAPGSWRSVRVAGRLLTRPTSVALDLNGVVKSMAVDVALRLVAGEGFVAAGGDVAVRGSTSVALPGGGAVQLLDGGLATSGVVQRRWSRAGERQHHLLDTGTGRPARSRWSQVTVAAHTCVAADVAAKAAFFLSDEGPDWLDQHGLPGRFLEGEKVVTNRAWQRAIDGDVRFGAAA